MIKNDPHPSWKMSSALIKEYIETGNSSQALSLIMNWTGSPYQILDKGDWGEWLSFLVRIITLQSTSSKLISSANSAADNPFNPDCLLQLGMNLIEGQQPAVAASVLEYTLKVDPYNHLVLAELVAALEMDGRHDAAAKFLDAAGDMVLSNPFLLYLKIFNAFFVADIETPRELLPILQKSDDNRITFMTLRIECMLNRSDFIKDLSSLDPSNERGWHFVLTGGLLLRESPNIIPSDDYSEHYDTREKLVDDIKMFAMVLDAWNLFPKKISFPPERNSEILAHIIAEILNVPTRKWIDDETAELIAVYDQAYVLPELLEPLRKYSADQFLYMHMADQTKESFVSPDILSGYYCRNTPIWGPGFGAKNNYIEPSKGTPSSIANDILKETSGTRVKEGDVKPVEFAKAVRHFFRDNPLTVSDPTPMRERLWNGSPARYKK